MFERLLRRPGVTPTKTVDERLDRILSMTKDLRAQVAQLESQVAMLLRQRVLTNPSGDPIAALDRARFAYFSQHEEDGVLHALFQAIGTTDHRFVEIGCGSNGGNSGFLARECGWSGLMIDAAERNVRATRRLFDRSRVAVVQVTVGSQGVVDLLAQHGIPREFDLLSLDIDSTDYWVLEALLAAHRPRVMIVEYNSAFGPTAAVTVPDSWAPPPAGKGIHHYWRGASLRAFCHLAAVRGYRLLLTDPTGTNALFLRDDIGPHLPGADPGEVFRYYAGHEVLVDELGDIVSHLRGHGYSLVDV